MWELLLVFENIFSPDWMLLGFVLVLIKVHY